MANDNDFSFGNLGNDYDDRKVNSDYLDLLSETKVTESEVRREAINRDIYSSSEREVSSKSFVNNIYADDEPEDVFTLSDEPPQYEDVYSNSDIYMSKIRATRREEREYEDIPIAPRQRTQQGSSKTATMDLDDDEISDYEVRRGKQVAPKKKKKRKSPKIVVVLALILAVVVAFSGVLISSANSIVNNFTKGEEIEHIENVNSLTSRSDVKNILSEN